MWIAFALIAGLVVGFVIGQSVTAWAFNERDREWDIDPGAVHPSEIAEERRRQTERSETTPN
jgi:hypothetical protein